MAAFLRDMQESPLRNSSSAETPVATALEDFVPDDVVAAVIAHGKEGHPVVAAVKGSQLYLVGIQPNDLSPDEPKAKVRLVCLDPTVVSASVEAGYRGDARFLTRSAKWTFSLQGGVHLEIPSTVAPEERGSDPGERVAVAIAEGLGWEIPN